MDFVLKFLKVVWNFARVSEKKLFLRPSIRFGKLESKNVKIDLVF
jgi:hypothetical protein